MPEETTIKESDIKGINKIIGIPKIKDININKNLRFEQIDNKDGFYITFSLPGSDSATAAKYGVIWSVRNPCEILWVAESHAVAGSDGGSVGLNIERLSGTEALDGGDEMLVADIDLKGTANTVVQRQGVDLQNRKLIRGDRIAVKDSGTLTSLEGVQLTLYFRPFGKGDYR